MTTFKTLFGCCEEHIANSVLLLPFLPQSLKKELPSSKWNQGKRFSCFFYSDQLTIIDTGFGSQHTHEALTHLNSSNVENYFFYGSCGAFRSQNKFQIGDMLIPEQGTHYTDHSHKLKQDFSSTPNQTLIRIFLQKHSEIQKAQVASYENLKNENNYSSEFQKFGMHAIDFETATFFNSTAQTKRRAFALLFVSDYIGEDPFLFQKKCPEKKIILESAFTTFKILTAFIHSQHT